jgi:membrane protein required for colicin V production
MTLFDYVVMGIVGLSLLFGLWRGVVGELLALLAWGLGLFVAMSFGERLGHLVFSSINDPSMRMLAGCILAFVGVLVCMALVRMAIQRMVKVLGLSLSDRLLGMVFGLIRGVLVCMVLVGLGGMTAAPKKMWWREARLSPPMETAVLAVKPWLPDDLAKRIRFS